MKRKFIDLINLHFFDESHEREAAHKHFGLKSLYTLALVLRSLSIIPLPYFFFTDQRDNAQHLLIIQVFLTLFMAIQEQRKGLKNRSSNSVILAIGMTVLAVAIGK